MRQHLYRKSLVVLTLAIMANACSQGTNEAPQNFQDNGTDMRQDSDISLNPFFTPSPLPHNYPRFDLIENEHYLPAFERGMAEQRREIDAIVNQSEAPTFANTLIPLEQSGRLLDRVSYVFFGLSSAHTNDTIKAIETEISPALAAHNDWVRLNDALFDRIEAVYRDRHEMELDPESLRLVAETRDEFIRSGAHLDEAQKERLKEINTSLAELSTLFSQNVLDEVNDLAIVVENDVELAGLSSAEIEAAALEAESRGLPGRFVIPLLNTSNQPVLARLEDRALRQRIHETSLSRGHRGGAYDNREIVSQVLSLRAEKARLLGFDNHAQYVLQNQTAMTADAVNERLADLVPAAAANARREAADLQALIDAQGGDFQLAAWDWSWYAEQLRRQRYDFDESELRPYFEVDNVMQNGLFYAAGQLFGIRFEERNDLPVYQEDVRVFEVFNEGGSRLAFLIMDLYARPTKSGGAWMNNYVPQSTLLGTRPVVGNHLNIPEPPAGEPTLMTFDEVITLFHEFGHALHGMFSRVTYPSFSGTSVPRDFVEYPSQVNEMWATWPEVLENYAVHYQTGEPMPPELLARVLESQRFNQGYNTTEYLSASVIDMALHQLAPQEVPDADDLMRFEQNVLIDAGIAVEAIPPRYRVTYFSHIMGGYSAGYYSYIWSEVLDADTVEWFRENGGMTRENGEHFRSNLLSRGGSVDAMTLYRDFRGRDADVEPLLERRGLN